jgi:hypothetical protein
MAAGTVSLVRFALDSPGPYRLMFDVTQREENDRNLATPRKRGPSTPARALKAALGR